MDVKFSLVESAIIDPPDMKSVLETPPHPIGGSRGGLGCSSHPPLWPKSNLFLMLNIWNRCLSPPPRNLSMLSWRWAPPHPDVIYKKFVRQLLDFENFLDPCFRSQGGGANGHPKKIWKPVIIGNFAPPQLQTFGWASQPPPREKVFKKPPKSGKYVNWAPPPQQPRGGCKWMLTGMSM